MNFTTTVSGPVVVGMLAVISGIIALIRYVLQTRADVKTVNNKVTPVANGFAEDILNRLKRMESQISRVESNVDMLNTTMTDHLEYHVRRR